MAEKNTGDDKPEETQDVVEDPEEVAAREAGNNATLTLVDTDSDGDTDEDVNPGEHVPHTEYAREV